MAYELHPQRNYQSGKPWTFYIYGEITNNTAFSFRKDVDTYCMNGTKRTLKIEINSEGGDIGAMLSILEGIKQAKDAGCIVETIVIGRCASAATLISIAGTKGYRKARKHALFHIHRVVVDKDNQPIIDFIKHDTNMVANHYKEYAGEKLKEMFEATDVKGFTLDAWTAQEYRMIDHIG